MRLRDVEVFNAVMQCGSVKGAAALLHVTQPAASRLLQQAERRAGFALFRRTRGRLVPTGEAQALYAEVEQLYARLEGIRRLVDSLALGSADMLRVLCVPSLELHWLVPALAALQARFPKARMSLRTAYSRQIAEGLALREADVGFTFEAAHHPAVAGEPVAEGELVCVGALHQRELGLPELCAQRVIALDPADPLGRPLHAALAAQGLALASSVLAHNYQTAVAMARHGLGIALVDSFTAAASLAQVAADPTLRCAPLRPRIAVSVHALRPAGAASSALVEHLVQEVQQALRSGAV